MAFHLVLRAPRKVRIGPRVFDTIEEHNHAFQSHNSVTFAKFGARVSDSKLNRLRAEIAANRAVHLYLVFKENQAFHGFRARISRVDTPENRATNNSPAYYAELSAKPSTMIVLCSPLKSFPLEGLRLVSNNRSLTDVIAECRTAAMLVYSDQAGDLES